MVRLRVPPQIRLFLTCATLVQNQFLATTPKPVVSFMTGVTCEAAAVCSPVCGAARLTVSETHSRWRCRHHGTRCFPGGDRVDADRYARGPFLSSL